MAYFFSLYSSNGTDRFNNWFDHTQKLLVICALTVAAYKFLPSTFVPNEDSGYFIAAVSLPEGTSLNRTYNLMSDLSDEIYQTHHLGRAHDQRISHCQYHSRGKQTRQESPRSLNHGDSAARLARFRHDRRLEHGTFGHERLQQRGIGRHCKKNRRGCQSTSRIAEGSHPYSINSPICNFELNRNKAKQLGDFMQFGRNYKIMLQSDAQYRTRLKLSNSAAFATKTVRWFRLKRF